MWFPYLMLWQREKRVREETESAETMMKWEEHSVFENQTDQGSDSNCAAYKLLYLWTRKDKNYQTELLWKLNELIYEKFLDYNFQM